MIHLKQPLRRWHTRYAIPRNQMNRSVKLTHLFTGCSNEKRVHQHSQQEALPRLSLHTSSQQNWKKNEIPKNSQLFHCQSFKFSNWRSTTHSHTHSHTLDHTPELFVPNFFTVDLSKVPRRTLRNAHLFFENT